MKFYRNTYTRDGSNAGFKWFTSKDDAQKDAKNADDGVDVAPVAEALDIDGDKKALVKALNKYAAHAAGA